MSGVIELVLGGARCGKSDWAVARARERGGDVLFVATAEPGDEEMRARIAAHRRQRPERWHTLEEPLEVAAELQRLGRRYDVVVIDCLTLLVSNWLAAGRLGPVRREARPAPSTYIQARIGALCGALRSCSRYAIVVSNEVGSGIVPRSGVARRFRDDLGAANRRLAEEAEGVYLLVAGLPLPLKQEEPMKREEPKCRD